MLILFGTEGCHLCDQAEQILLSALAERTEHIEFTGIDIAEHKQWREKYAIRIPVLYHPDSQAELSWPFDQNKVHEFVNRLLK